MDMEFLPGVRLRSEFEVTFLTMQNPHNRPAEIFKQQTGAEVLSSLSDGAQILAGSQYFSVDELEVFEVIIKS
jgi:hypothetical protein